MTECDFQRTLNITEKKKRCQVEIAILQELS